MTQRLMGSQVHLSLINITCVLRLSDMPSWYVLFPSTAAKRNTPVQSICVESLKMPWSIPEGVGKPMLYLACLIHIQCYLSWKKSLFDQAKFRVWTILWKPIRNVSLTYCQEKSSNIESFFYNNYTCDWTAWSHPDVITVCMWRTSMILIFLHLLAMVIYYQW